MSNLKLTKIIAKKRNRGVLTPDEISYFVDSVAPKDKNNVADRCQIGAMLMAIYMNGLDAYETEVLTHRMKDSGHVFQWPKEYQGIVVDKHSTGGVGDKISLILAPVLAALGLKVPMISGRSLGHTGGTLDKLESIPGYNVYLDKEKINGMLKTVGCCIVGQTEDCVPADKVLYYCREITATVDYSPLIIASIISKKLSEGLDTVVYDVKFGRGSNFKSKEEAEETAKRLVHASKSVKTAAVLTSMQNPLGRTIGNALEVRESIECLKGSCPPDILQVLNALGSEILRLSKNIPLDEGIKMISNVLLDGSAMRKFCEMIILQGVPEDKAMELCYGLVDSILPATSRVTRINHKGDDGYISGIDPFVLAEIWKEEEFYAKGNCGVGFKLLKTVGDKIKTGEAWLEFHHEHNEITAKTENELSNALELSTEHVERKVIDQRIFFIGGEVVIEKNVGSCFL